MDPQALAKLVDSAPALIATKYFTLTGCIIVLWDHLLTFRGEMEYIWKRPIAFNRAMFLFNRYLVAGALCCSVYIQLDLRGPLSQEICHTYTLFITITSIVAITIANLVVIFHIQSIWEKQRAITYALLAGFIVTYGVTAVCAGLVANDLQSHILWVPEVKTCVILQKPMTLIGVWAGMVTFDLFVLLMMFANAVNRPYRQSSEVVHCLDRDGMKFFATLLVMRFANLLLTIFSTPGEALMIVFFLWAIVSVTLSRFLLMINAAEKEAASGEGIDYNGRGTPATITWSSHSGYWSRKSDAFELKVAP